MKILYVVSTLESCGPINILYNIIKYLNEKENEIVILTLSKELSSSRKKEFIELGCQVSSLNTNRINGIFKNDNKIREVVLDIDPDIIHSHGFRANCLVAKLKNVKTITTLHNYPYEDYVMSYGNFLGKYMANREMKNIKEINQVVCCSNSIAKKISKNQNIKLKSIQNGIDLDKFHLNNNCKKNENEVVFISIGVLSARKNPLLIIEAFKEVNKKYANVKLVFLGDGELMKECLNYSESSNVYLYGNVSNVNEFLEKSTYYISASKSEGLPNTVLEAMAKSVPCILSNIDSHIEISNDKEALIFNEGDALDLIEKMYYAIDNPDEMKKYAKYANEKISKVLNAKEMSLQYQEIYKEMIEV